MIVAFPGHTHLLFGFVCIFLCGLSILAIISLRKRELAAFLTCFLALTYVCLCLTTCLISLPRGVMGWSMIGACGISWSFSSVFVMFYSVSSV